MKRNIIVIGASMGGLDAIQKVITSLPADMDAAIFVVWHMSPDVTGILPQVINRKKKLHAAHATDGEPVTTGRVYVAPPDHHMLLEKGMVRVTRGPKENHFRPAIDPLFRSAAYAYGPGVIGVILTGALDDGSAGLWTVKEYGGLAVVQDPADAEVPSMPENALRHVKADYKVPLKDMAALLGSLSSEQVEETTQVAMNEHEKTKFEVNVALDKNEDYSELLKYGIPSLYTCPECHGVLVTLKDGELVRFRCHTGHAYSPDTLLAAISKRIEGSLWSTVRSVHESVLLLNNIGDHFAEINQPKIAALYFRKAKEVEARMAPVRQALLKHEQLNTEGIERQPPGSPPQE